MNSNNMLAAGKLINLAAIDSTLNSLQAAPSMDQGPSFESVLEDQIQQTQEPETQPPQSAHAEKPAEPKKTDQPATKKVEEPKANETAANDHVEKEAATEQNAEKTSDSTKEKGREDNETENTGKTEENQTPSDKKQTDSEKGEKLASSAQASDALLKLQSQQKTNPAAQNQTDLTKAESKTVNADNLKHAARQTIDEKLITYTDSKGKTKTLRLNYASTDVDKLSQQAAQAENTKQTFAKTLQTKSENLKTDAKTDNNDIELRKVDDKSSLLKVARQSGQERTLTQRASDQNEMQDAKKKELSLSDLFSRNRVKNASTEEKPVITEKTLSQESTELTKLESLFAKNGKAQMLNPTEAHIPFDTAMDRIRQTSAPQIRQVEARQQVLNQFLDAAKAHLSKDNSQMTVKLKPDYLGEINMKIQIQNTGASRSSVMVGQIEVENSAVKDILQSNLSQLKSHLENQNGIQIKKFEILVKQELPEQYQQPQQQQQNHPGHQNRRPIHFANFGYSEDEDVLYNTTAEEKGWPPGIQNNEYLIKNGYSWVA